MTEEKKTTRRTTRKDEPAAATEEAPKPAPPKTKSDMVTVVNHCSGHFVQPSTGIRIAGKEQKDLRDDGWLRLQVKAGLMEIK